LNTIIDRVIAWTEAHPKLTAVIEVVIVTLAVLLSLAVAFLGVAAAVILAVGVLGVAFFGWVAAIIAAVALMAAIVVAVVLNWQQIETFTQKIWNDILTWIKNQFGILHDNINVALQAIQAVWNTVWGAVETFFEGIWDGIKNSLSSAISFLTSTIQTFVSWATGAFAPVMTAVNAIGGAASAFGKAASNVISGVVSKVDDAIIAPNGNIVSTAPDDYLIATKNPGGLAMAGAGNGGGSVINVYIQGGNYLDSNGADTIAAALAKKIQQQLKLTNFR
jgi:phage-related protein